MLKHLSVRHLVDTHIYDVVQQSTLVAPIYWRDTLLSTEHLYPSRETVGILFRRQWSSSRHLVTSYSPVHVRVPFFVLFVERCCHVNSSFCHWRFWSFLPVILRSWQMESVKQFQLILRSVAYDRSSEVSTWQQQPYTLSHSDAIWLFGCLRTS